MTGRSLYEDKLDWLMLVADIMKKLDYGKQEIAEREDLSLRLSYAVRSLNKMIHREDRLELLIEAESILQNITASLAWLNRNDKICKQQRSSVAHPFNMRIGLNFRNKNSEYYD